MTREQFIKKLEKKGYSYEIEGDNLAIPRIPIPPGLVFTMVTDVELNDFTSIPPGVEFKAGRDVKLGSLTSLPPGVVFNNWRDVVLSTLTSIPPGVVFNNVWGVWLESLIGGWFHYWKGNIDGIEPTSILNVMIKRGMFI